MRRLRGDRESPRREAGQRTDRLDEVGQADMCLACRRSRVAEAALDRRPARYRPDKCRRIRRALIEFEMRRTPDRGNGRIASACGTSPVAVAAVRRILEAADSLP